ncbi:MAG: hypothetical protein JNM27_21280 [Leptospirales bacterium]|nr:hypothetical protein [Leptospirales bacterium]
MTPKEESEELMSSLVPFAEEMLTKHREFYPFGGFMRTNGKIEHLGGYDGNEHPSSDEIIKLLRAGLRDSAKKGEIKAAAIVFDVRVVAPGTTEKSDAIEISLEHKEGYAAEVYFPYHFSEDGKLAFGQIFAAKKIDSFFR